MGVPPKVDDELLNDVAAVMARYGITLPYTEVMDLQAKAASLSKLPFLAQSGQRLNDSDSAEGVAA